MVAKKKSAKKTVKKAPKKVTTKKTVKKTVKKKTTKKVAPKKTVKKAVKKKTAKKVAPKKTVKKAVKRKTTKKVAPKKTVKKAVKKKITKKVAPKKTAKTVVKKATKKTTPKKTTKKVVKSKTVLKGKTLNMNKKDVEKFKKILLIMKEKLYHDIHDIESGNLKKSQRDITGDLSGYSLHLADMGTENFDRELALNLASQESNILYEVDRALQRIEDNTFGICECGKNIQIKRLQAVPYASLCIQCKEEEEAESKMRFE